MRRPPEEARRPCDHGVTQRGWVTTGHRSACSEICTPTVDDVRALIFAVTTSFRLFGTKLVVVAKICADSVTADRFGDR